MNADYNLTLADKLERRALTIAYLREIDAKASTAVNNASHETWEAKSKAWGKARHNYNTSLLGNGWVPFYEKARAAADKADEKAYQAYTKACSREGLNAHGRTGWRVHGRPTGPI